MNEKFASPIDFWLEGLREEEARLVKELAVIRRVLAAASDAGTGQTLRDLLTAEPGKVWTAAEVKTALEGRGWASTSTDPVNVVRAHLARGVNEGWLVRLERGQYRFWTGSAE